MRLPRLRGGPSQRRPLATILKNNCGQVKRVDSLLFSPLATAKLRGSGYGGSFFINVLHLWLFKHALVSDELVVMSH